MSFYTPWQLAGAKLDGAPVEMERATELGRQVYSAAVVMPAKSTVTLELTLSGRLPGAAPTDSTSTASRWSPPTT